MAVCEQLRASGRRAPAMISGLATRAAWDGRTRPKRRGMSRFWWWRRAPAKLRSERGGLRPNAFIDLHF